MKVMKATYVLVILSIFLVSICIAMTIAYIYYHRKGEKDKNDGEKQECSTLIEQEDFNWQAYSMIQITLEQEYHIQ